MSQSVIFGIDSSTGKMVPVKVNSNGEVAVTGDTGGGGGSGSDREFVVSTYKVKTAFSGASVNDVITCTRILDVTSTPTVVSTIWRNETTALDLGAAPSAANLTLIGSDALTDAQLRASAVSVTDSRLPASVGAKTSAGSLSVVPATDAVSVTGGITANPSANFTRPADTTAYASGDLVANNTTAGSVAAMQLTVTRVAAGSAILRRINLRKSGTSLTNASFRVHLFSAAPTVANGDNGVLSMSGVANYLGRADITIDQAFTDGAWGSTDLTFVDENVKLASGQILYALLEARAAYTPVSAEVFTLVAEVLQD